MFFTKIIIDASNITTLVFYKQIITDAKNVSANMPKAGDNFVSANLNGAAGLAASKQEQWLSFGIMNALGLSSVWGVAKNNGSTGVIGAAQNISNDPAVNSGSAVASNAGGTAAVTNPWTMTLVALGGSVFVLILSFVFFATTIMLLMRIVVLILLIVTSPAAFAARVLPKTSKWSDDWWNKLINNALFAPVYMALLFVTLKMVWAGNNKVGDNLLSLFSNTGSGGIQAIMFFVLICAMLVGCLLAATSFGTAGSKMVQGWGKSLGNKATNYAKSRAFAPVSYIADKASKSSFVATLVGGRGLQSLDKLAQAKVGGSSYRSRVEGDKTTYQTRSDLIKKAATGDLIRRQGETDKEFKERKEKYEGYGKDAQKKYLGISTEKDSNEVVSDSMFKGKQQARQDLINKNMSAKADPSIAIIEKEKEAISTGIPKLLSIVEGAQLSGHINAAAVKQVKDFIQDKKEIERDKTTNEIVSKSVKPAMVYKLIEKIEEPLSQISKEIGNIENDVRTHSQTIRSHPDGSTDPVAIQKLEGAMRKLTAAQASLTVATGKKNELVGLISQLTNSAKRVQDTEAQSKLKGAIEENKPKS
jgi:hypothetical protein